MPTQPLKTNEFKKMILAKPNAFIVSSVYILRMRLYLNGFNFNISNHLRYERYNTEVGIKSKTILALCIYVSLRLNIVFEYMQSFALIYYLLAVNVHFPRCIQTDVEEIKHM